MSACFQGYLAFSSGRFRKACFLVLNCLPGRLCSSNSVAPRILSYFSVLSYRPSVLSCLPFVLGSLPFLSSLPSVLSNLSVLNCLPFLSSPSFLSCLTVRGRLPCLSYNPGRQSCLQGLLCPCAASSFQPSAASQALAAAS